MVAAAVVAVATGDNDDGRLTYEFCAKKSRLLYARCHESAANRALLTAQYEKNRLPDDVYTLSILYAYLGYYNIVRTSYNKSIIGASVDIVLKRYRRSHHRGQWSV